MGDTTQFTSPVHYFHDNSGNVLTDGKLFFYEAGTTTKITTYSNQAKTVENTNPIVLDANGKTNTAIYMDVDDYKVVLTTSGDTDPPSSPLWTRDNYRITSQSSFAGGLETSSNQTRIYSPANNQTGTSYTIQDTDRAKTISFNNANAVAVTLPEANSTTFTDGWFCNAVNVADDDVTITPTTSTINEASSLVLKPGESARITSDGTNYFAGLGFVPKATEAQMKSETANKFVDAESAKYSPGTAKFWVNFNGTGTIAIREDYNVSGLVDNSATNYTVTIDNDMANADYCVVASCDSANGDGVYYATIDSMAAGSVTIDLHGEGGATGYEADQAIVCVAGFGTLA